VPVVIVCLYPDVAGAQRQSGCVRSSAWHWLFSSQHSTRALSGGFRYKPITSQNSHRAGHCANAPAATAFWRLGDLRQDLFDFLLWQRRLPSTTGRILQSCESFRLKPARPLGDARHADAQFFGYLFQLLASSPMKNDSRPLSVVRLWREPIPKLDPLFQS
jgi:hypothetical protein